MNIELAELLNYTAWQREKWRVWFRQQGNAPLSVSVGANGDGRFQTIGDVIRHIFSAEMRYVDRLTARPITDTSSVATVDADGLFRLADDSRRRLHEFLGGAEVTWDVPEELTIGRTFRITPRRIVVHILLHEIRHWAQIGTLLRLNGFKVEWHDFLFFAAE